MLWGMFGEALSPLARMSLMLAFGVKALPVLSSFLKKSIYIWLHWVFVAARGLSLVAAHRFLIAVASLIVEHGSRHAGFSSRGAWV